MKKCVLYLQKKSYTCGPAALRTILSYFGIRKSEAVLARLCHTTTEGTTPKALVAAAKSLGARVRAKEHGSIAMLHRFVHDVRVPVLLEWFQDHPEGSGYHFSVVVHTSKKFLWLIDPEWPTVRRMRIVHFLPRWHGYDTPARRSYRRWYMVLAFDAPLLRSRSG